MMGLATQRFIFHVLLGVIFAISAKNLCQAQDRGSYEDATGATISQLGPQLRIINSDNGVKATTSNESNEREKIEKSLRQKIMEGQGLRSQSSRKITPPGQRSSTQPIARDLPPHSEDGARWTATFDELGKTEKRQTSQATKKVSLVHESSDQSGVGSNQQDEKVESNKAEIEKKCFDDRLLRVIYGEEQFGSASRKNPIDPKIASAATKIQKLQGMEALAELDGISEADPDATVLRAVALALHGARSRLRRLLTESECGSAHELWSTFARIDEGVDPFQDGASVSRWREALDDLPLLLRGHVAVQLGAEAAMHGRKNLAQWLHDIAAMSGPLTGDDPRLLEFTTAMLTVDDRLSREGETLLLALSRGDDAVAARSLEALMHNAEERRLFGQDRDYALDDYLGAMAFQLRGQRRGGELLKWEGKNTAKRYGADAAVVLLSYGLAKNIIDIEEFQKSIIDITNDCNIKRSSEPLALFVTKDPKMFLGAHSVSEFRKLLAISYAEIGALGKARQTLDPADLKDYIFTHNLNQYIMSFTVGKIPQIDDLEMRTLSENINTSDAEISANLSGKIIECGKHSINQRKRVIEKKNFETKGGSKTMEVDEMLATTIRDELKILEILSGE